MFDNRISIKVRIQEEEITFGNLIAGRCFIMARELKSPNQVYIKLKKGQAQRLEDENYRMTMIADIKIHEVVLVMQNNYVNEEVRFFKDD